MEANTTVQVLVAMGIANGMRMADLQDAIKVEWLRQKRAARTPEQRAAAAAKAKATREERKAARPVPTWYGQTPYEQATAANGRRVRQVLGEAGWQAFLAAKDVAAYGGHQYDNNTILRHAVGTRAALDVLEAAGLHETANF